MLNVSAEDEERCWEAELPPSKPPPPPRVLCGWCTYSVQACALVGGAVVAVQGVEPLPERGLVDGGMQHLQGQRVAPGVLSVIQLPRRRPPSARANQPL